MASYRSQIPAAENESNPERRKILAAMFRIFLSEEPQVATHGERLVIDTLRREAAVTRSALTHRHTDLKDLFLQCAAERLQQAQHRLPQNESALEKEIEDLRQRNTDLQAAATRWENAARDLARAVAALQALNATANARLDAVIKDVTAKREKVGYSNVSPMNVRVLE